MIYLLQMTKANFSLPEPPKDLSTLEVAQWLGVTVRTVQLMVDRGDLRAWKTPGGHRRIDPHSVEAWRDQPNAKRDEPAPAPPAPTAQSTRHADTTCQRSIVLIEQDPVLQHKLQRVLARSYPMHQLHTASEAITGIALCSTLHPELLLLNANLPGMDGASVVRGLQHHPRLKHLPVALLLPQGAPEPADANLRHVHLVPLETLRTHNFPMLSRVPCV
jgi:excisionase family DNA binding protein